MPARAQNATWSTAPGSSDFNTAANWTPATVPTGTAFFGASNTTALTFSQVVTPTSVGGFTFNVGAPAYTFALPPFLGLTFTGAGIINNSSSAPAFIVLAASNLGFVNSSTAGNAVITNTGGSVNFSGASSAGNATIANNSFLNFVNTSTAGNATITTTGLTFFYDRSTGGNAQLITNAGGAVTFLTTGPAGDNQITAGSIAGAGNYDLGANTLTVGGNNLSTTVSGTISGIGGGSLVKTGTGILTLSGTNTYTGTTTVNAGALVVDGSIASSSLTTVNSGAILLGSGTVGSTVVNAGAAIVPTGNSPGTMNVAGDLTIQRNAFYVVQVNPLMASRLNVSGSASLDGTVAAVFTPGIYLSRSYTILTADNRRTGRFEDLETFGLPRNFRARLDYFNNSVDLNLRAQLIGGGVGGEATVSRPIVLPPIPGLPLPPEDLPGSAPPGSALPPFTGNQVNAGRAIDNFFNNGGTLPPTFVSLYGLSGANLTNALDQLAGEAATGAQQVGFQLGNQFLNLMLDPFVDGRSGVGGADHPALGFAPERDTMPPDIAHAYAAVLKAPPKAGPVYEPRWTMWGGAYGGSNRTTGDLAVVGSHDLSANTAGFAGGLDYRLTPDTVVGFALAGGGTHWNLAQGLGGGKSDGLPGRRLRRNACRTGLSRSSLRLHQSLDVDRPSRRRRPPHRQFQRAELRRAA
jgi:autotransporter-associated beta strand protein